MAPSERKLNATPIRSDYVNHKILAGIDSRGNEGPATCEHFADMQAVEERQANARNECIFQKSDEWVARKPRYSRWHDKKRMTKKEEQISKSPNDID